MKKLLLVLTVVAMASLLFTGCLPTVPVAVTGVTLDQATMALTAGGATGTLVETVVPADATDKTVTWSSSAPAVATVANGVVTPLTAGTTTITVTTVDGSLTATCEVTVAAPVTHVAPTLAAIANQIAYYGEAFTYPVVATAGTDPVLTFSLPVKPPIMSIVPATGVISWTPIAAQVGYHDVTVKVTAADGLFDEVSFIIEVREPVPVPVGPTVVSLLPLVATVGEAYVGQVTATAGDNATLTYSLIAAPGDMAISATGVITWIPAAAGPQVVTVKVTDGAALSDTKGFTIVVAPRVAPTLAAIANQIAYYGEAFTYTVVATAGTDPVLTFSLPVKPTMMSIVPATGVISWTPIAAQLGYHDVTVKVTAADGLFAEVSFIIEVREPLPAPPLGVTIEYAPTHSYDDGTTIYVRGYKVAADCVPVTVTLSEAVEEDIEIRWNDGTSEGDWVTLTGDDDGMIFTGCLPFDGVVWDDCEIVCVEVATPEEFCPTCPATIIGQDIVTVDSEPPCASFTVTIEDCTQDPCAPLPGASMFWTTECNDVCDIPAGCCGDFCSGVGDWSFILDETECADPCDTEDGEDCPINGAFECRCLLYATSDTVDHVIDVTIADNVGNTFTDTWTLTFDTDSLVSFSALNTTPFDNSDGTWSLDYNCTWHDCEECFPTVG